MLKAHKNKCYFTYLDVWPNGICGYTFDVNVPVTVSVQEHVYPGSFQHEIVINDGAHINSNFFVFMLLNITLKIFILNSAVRNYSQLTQSRPVLVVVSPIFFVKKKDSNTRLCDHCHKFNG